MKTPRDKADADILTIKGLLTSFKQDIEADIDDSDGPLGVSDLKHIRDIVNETLDAALADATPALTDATPSRR